MCSLRQRQSPGWGRRWPSVGRAHPRSAGVERCQVVVAEDDAGRPAVVQPDGVPVVVPDGVSVALVVDLADGGGEAVEGGVGIGRVPDGHLDAVAGREPGHVAW